MEIHSGCSALFYTEYNLNTSGALSFYLSEFLNFCPQSLSLYTWDDCLNRNRSLNDASSKSWSHPQCITSRLYKNTNILLTLESAYFRHLSLFPRFNSQISNAYWILSVGYPVGILNLFCPKHKSSLFFHLNLICFLSCLITLSLTRCPRQFLRNHSMYFFLSPSQTLISVSNSL